METKVIKAYEEQGGELLTHAKAVTIIDVATRQAANEFTSNTRIAIKAIEEEFKPDIQKAHELHKDLLDRMKRLLLPFQQAKRIIDAEISRDYLEQEKIRREEERQARLKADAERIAQEEARAKEISDAIDMDDMALAEALVDSEVVTAPIVPATKVEKTVRSGAGTTTVRKDINVELVDKMVVIRAVANGKLPNTLLDVNLGNAKRYAKVHTMTVMPGFQITETAVVAGRTR